MENLKSKTITTLEVAEMMETEHWKLLRKLEGRTGKDGVREKGYLEILGDHQMVGTDYFIKTSYLSEQNKELPCYEVTKIGCDFLANKFTGEKGVLFTARYVKKFQEMENNINYNVIPENIPVGEVANLTKTMDRIMVRQKSEPYKIAEAFETICNQFGIVLPQDFVNVPNNNQLELYDFAINAKRL